MNKEPSSSACSSVMSHLEAQIGVATIYNICDPHPVGTIYKGPIAHLYANTQAVMNSLNPAESNQPEAKPSIYRHT